MAKTYEEFVKREKKSSELDKLKKKYIYGTWQKVSRSMSLRVRHQNTSFSLCDGEEESPNKKMRVKIKEHGLDSSIVDDHDDGYMDRDIYTLKMD